MTNQQKRLLAALRDHGGVKDRYLRVLASGETFNTTTVLSCFQHGWIVSDGSRISLTDKGLSDALGDPS